MEKTAERAERKTNHFPGAFAGGGGEKPDGRGTGMETNTYYYAGIDIGSTTVKLVVVDEKSQILYTN